MPNKELVDAVGRYVDKYYVPGTDDIELDKEMKKMYFTSVNDWQLTLRNDPNKMDVNYLNLGSIKRPNWQMIVKNPINDEKEIVRNPSKNEIIHAQKERNTFLKNSYLKEVLPYKSFYLREHDKLDLEIKGKDLLAFEQNEILRKYNIEIFIIPEYYFAEEIKEML